MHTYQLRCFVTGVVLVSIFAAAPAAVIWAEAESFDNIGGWSNDSQHMDIMGSPYLLATGVGNPVADAITRISVAQSGTYRLWVRCRDWFPSHSPGQFQVIVGGKTAGVTFGKAATDAWQWVDGGTFELVAGQAELRLHDLTGWWGRCDAVVLATEDFRPAEELPALAQQRMKYFGVSPQVKECGAYDVVVTGGGLAGCAAAVAAARHGCKVALIQDRPVLGGNASSEIQVPVEGDRAGGEFNPFDTGIIEEFFPLMRQTGRSKELEDIVRAETGISLFLNTRAVGVDMKDKKTIAAVLAIDVRTGQRMRFAGDNFIDCTGHGWIGFWSGATCRQGEESIAESNEPCAAPRSTARTMGNSLYNAVVRDRRTPTEFHAPQWAYHWTRPEDFEPRTSHARLKSGRPDNYDIPSRGKGRMPRPDDIDGGINHDWTIETGGMLDTIKDAEVIRDELFRINLGLWDYAKNHNPQTVRTNANRELVWMNYVPGVRESRRIIGDYILSENDYLHPAVHDDDVAYTGWGADIHHPEGFWVKGVDCMHYYRNVRAPVPFRSLYSRDIDNLMMAGRCHSATHIGMGGTRIMRTCCEMGEAVGIAAALMKKYQTTPRGLYKGHIQELQQALLKDGAYIIGVPNTDPLDLALKAKASASSIAPAVTSSKNDGPPGGRNHGMDIARAVCFLAGEDRIDSISLFLENKLDKPATLRAVLRSASRLGDFTSDKDLASAEAVVPAKSADWVEFRLSAKVEKAKAYYVCLPPTEGLYWRVYPGEMKNASRAYNRGLSWTPMDYCYKFRLSPGGEPVAIEATELAARSLLGPENVNNGWNRAVGKNRNAWMPDSKAPMPQWVQLDLPAVSEVNSVHVSFSTQVDRGVDFVVQAFVNSEWKEVAQVKDNEARRRVLNFPAVKTDKVRLQISKMTSKAGICEIRLYNETK